MNSLYSITKSFVTSATIDETDTPIRVPSSCEQLFTKVRTLLPFLEENRNARRVYIQIKETALDSWATKGTIINEYDLFWPFSPQIVTPKMDASFFATAQGKIARKIVCTAIQKNLLPRLPEKAYFHLINLKLDEGHCFGKTLQVLKFSRSCSDPNEILKNVVSSRVEVIFFQFIESIARLISSNTVQANADNRALFNDLKKSEEQLNQEEQNIRINTLQTESLRKQNSIYSNQSVSKELSDFKNLQQKAVDIFSNQAQMLNEHFNNKMEFDDPYAHNDVYEKITQECRDIRRDLDNFMNQNRTVSGFTLYYSSFTNNIKDALHTVRNLQDGLVKERSFEIYEEVVLSFAWDSLKENNIERLSTIQVDVKEELEGKLAKLFEDTALQACIIDFKNHVFLLDINNRFIYDQLHGLVNFSSLNDLKEACIQRIAYHGVEKLSLYGRMETSVKIIPIKTLGKKSKFDGV